MLSYCHYELECPKKFCWWVCPAHQYFKIVKNKRFSELFRQEDSPAMSSRTRRGRDRDRERIESKVTKHTKSSNIILGFTF